MASQEGAGFAPQLPQLALAGVYSVHVWVSSSFLSLITSYTGCKVASASMLHVIRIIR